MPVGRIASGSTRSTVARTRRWVAAWLIVAALLAVLLVGNSVNDYRRVSRILAVQQVRHRMSEYALGLENALRRSVPTAVLPGNVFAAETGPTLDDALWVELRRPDGGVIASRGNVARSTFTAEEQSTHFRAHQPLFTVVPSPAGEVLVEVFPLYGTSLGTPADSAAPAGVSPGRGPRSLLVVEIAAPLAIHDPSVLQPIRRALVITSTGALALLATVIVAGRAFRSYERGRWLEVQLEIAREVQTALLPSQTEDIEPMRLAASYRPAEQVGGDFYDVFQAADGRVALVVGDVAGKGVPAALVAGVIHGAVRSAPWTESRSRHERESERLNLLLRGDAAGARYASIFWGYYDTTTSTLHYVNAGHLPPIVIGIGAGARALTSLETGGPALGLLGDARYQQDQRELRPGETLVLYSDGIVEAASPAGEEFGADRLCDLLRASGDASPHEIRDAILAAVDAFTGEAPARDDLTLVVARLDASGRG